MKHNLSADEVPTSTRSVRKRLHFGQPVERAVEECLEIALQAPTGSNTQGWHWVVVENQAMKDAIATIYKANFALYRSMPPPQYEDDDTRGERRDKVVDWASFLTENVQRAPLMLIPCIWDDSTACPPWSARAHGDRASLPRCGMGTRVPLELTASPHER